MEKVNLNYLTKNIPIPSELVIKRMQWKAIYFNEGKGRRNQTEWYELRSTICPAQVNELVPSKKVLDCFSEKHTILKSKKPIRKKLQQDIEMIRASEKTMTFTDKTNNIYILSQDQYNTLLKTS